MTDRSSDGDDQSRADDGDIGADSENLSGAEAQQMNATPGRGSRSEPGAEASDEYIAEHVQGDTDQEPPMPDRPKSGN